MFLVQVFFVLIVYNAIIFNYLVYVCLVLLVEDKIALTVRCAFIEEHYFGWVCDESGYWVLFLFFYASR